MPHERGEPGDILLTDVQAAAPRPGSEHDLTVGDLEPPGDDRNDCQFDDPSFGTALLVGVSVVTLMHLLMRQR